MPSARSEPTIRAVTRLKLADVPGLAVIYVNNIILKLSLICTRTFLIQWLQNNYGLNTFEL